MNYLKLSCAIVLCQLAGVLGSFFSAESVSTWYTTLNKPFFNPPGWVFGPVWITLYLLIGIALYLVLDKAANDTKKTAVIAFFLQLLLNSVWSLLFFGLKNPLLAFIDIVLLWLAIIATMIFFRRISKKAAYLLVPYLGWVSFAAILNCAIVYLN